MTKDERYIKANLKTREENFDIEITENDSIIPDEIMIHITHDGHSWIGGLSLIPSEARALITELEKFASPDYKHVSIDTISLIYGNNLKE